jgi:hypothetical protein
MPGFFIYRSHRQATEKPTHKRAARNGVRVAAYVDATPSILHFAAHSCPPSVRIKIDFTLRAYNDSYLWWLRYSHVELLEPILMAVDLAADILPDPLLSPLVHYVRLDIACGILGFGRSKLYEALGRGELTAVKDGTRTLITIESIRAYQARRPVANFTPPPARSMESLNKLNEQLRVKAAAKRAGRRRRGGR